MYRRLSRNQSGAVALMLLATVAIVLLLIWEQWVFAGMIFSFILSGLGLITLFAYVRLGETNRLVRETRNESRHRTKTWKSSEEKLATRNDLESFGAQLVALEASINDLHNKSPAPQDLRSVFQLLESIEQRNRRLLNIVRAEMPDIRQAVRGVETELQKYREQSSLAERKVLNRLRKDNVFEAIRDRLEQTERRLVGSLEEERLVSFERWQYLQEQFADHESTSPSAVAGLTAELADRDREFKQFTEALQGLVGRMQSQVLTELSLSQKVLLREIDDRSARLRQGLSSHVTAVVRDNTRQVGALFQLMPKLSGTYPLLPPTGGFAIDAQALLHLIDILSRERPRLILELGGGTSTIWMGHVCREYGTKLVSIDHLQEYHAETQANVDRHGLSDVVECRLAPLEEITIGEERYEWYSLAALNDLEHIDVLVVDGPPEAVGHMVRFPALPCVEQQLAASTVVILDDTHRDAERAILDSWLERYPGFRLQDAGISRLGVLTRRDLEG